MKQILTARQCARLNKRMNYGAERVPERYSVQQYTQHPCIGHDRPRLPGVCVTCYFPDGGEEWLLFQPRNLKSAKIVRRYLFDTLPAWPDIEDVPNFDGFIDEAGFWYGLSRAHGVLDWTGRPE